MALLYIQSALGILELTVTMNIKITDKSSVTKHKMESSETISDNVVNENKEVSISGMISEVLRITFDPPSTDNEQILAEGVTPRDNFTSKVGNQKNVKDYLELLYKIRDSKELFTVYYDDRLDALTNCLFSNISISRDVKVGNGYNLDFSISQVRLGTRAKTSVVKIQSDPDNTDPLTKGSNNSTESVDPNTSLALSLFGG